MFKPVFEKRDNMPVYHYPLPIHEAQEDKLQGGHLRSVNVLQERNNNLYIHIPFCDKICKFCPFNKFVKEEEKVRAYLKNMYCEIDIYAEKTYIQDTEFQSIALGGGTPTCLSKEELCDIINYCKRKFNMNREVEVSIEGNPENSDFEKLSALAQCGVNRISFGIQTFNEELSDRLALQHTIQEGIFSIENAHKVGIDNVGIDLMYNIPGQTNEQFKDDILTAYKLGVEHITLFSMNVPPKTKMHQEIMQGKIGSIGDLNREIELYVMAEELLLSLGYEQYSVYDFALPNKRNLHAINYFLEQRELIGIGAAAFGYINGYMYVNSGQLSEYEDKVQNGFPSILYGEKACLEDQMYGLLVKGFRMLEVPKALFRRIFSKEVEEVFQDKFNVLIEAGLLCVNDYSVSLTRKGRIYGNNICQYFIQDKFKNPNIIRHMLTKGVKPEKF